MLKTKLTEEQIENKVFNVDFKGYSPFEVDSYLDLILEDYATFSKEIDSLLSKINHYEQVIDQLNQENQLLKGKLSSGDQNTPNNSTIDLIRRVARLEEVVFKQEK